MNADLLLQHFERISEAPDAIELLRRFILDLAVRGKLVEQDQKDVPADQLLLEVHKARLQLLSEKKIRDQGQAPPVEIDEQPFGIPSSWRWVRFGTIADFSAGKTPSRHDTSFWNTGDYPWLSIADMPNGGVIVATKETISEKAKGQVFKKGPSAVGTMVMSFKLTIGKIARLGVPSFHNEAIISIYPHLSALEAYLFKVLPQFSRRGEFKDAIKGATLNRDSIANILLPIPPLGEQHRIVTRVAELMALCDELDAARTEREQAREQLVIASLQRLNHSTDDLRENAVFTFNNFSRLTTSASDIKQFRQTILSLAVRGHLERQNYKDDPIQLPELRAFSAASGMDDQVFEQFKDSIPLPRGWQIAPLLQVAEYIVDCPHTTPKWTTEGEICVRTNQLRPRRLDLSAPRFVSHETYRERIERLEPQAGDILYSREGGILGIACEVPRGVRLCLGQRLMLIRPCSQINSTYLDVVLNSPFITGIAMALTTGGAAPRVNMSTVRAYPIPVPPLAEQARIVAKVNELMVLCDRLEEQLVTTENDSGRLLVAVLHEALFAPAMAAAA